MQNDNVRNFLGFDQGYYQINREERNLAAIFYHVLLMNDNLKRFLDTIGCDFPIVESECGIYFEYAFLRDLWSTKAKDNPVKRELILQFLKPSNREALEKMTTLEFNTYFGAVPKPSREQIQSPSNWSLSRYKETIKDPEEFLKVCQFKWAFNAKPDIVIHTSNDTAICIECKFESGEGFYPSKPEEIQVFNSRSLRPVSQTSLQEYVLEDLLGIKTKFIYLVQKENSSSPTHSTLLWKQAFSKLDLDHCPRFIQEWIRRLNNLQGK